MANKMDDKWVATGLATVHTETVWRKSPKDPSQKVEVTRYFVTTPGVHSETGARRPWRSGTHSSKTAARNAANNLNRQDPSVAHSSRTPLGRWLDEVFLPSERGSETATADNHIWAAEKIKAAPIGTMAIGDIDIGDVHKFLDSLRRVRGDESKPLARITRQRVLRTLKASLAMAHRHNRIAANPAADAVLAKVPVASDKLKVWSEAELAQFLRANIGSPIYRPLWVLVHTGVRRGELAGLQWSALSGNVLTISRSLTNKGELKGTKTGKPRSLPLDAETVKVLREHRDAQSKLFAELGLSAEQSEWMFILPDGGKLTDDRIRRGFEVAVATAGLPRMTPHNIRHSFATHSLARCKDSLDVANLANWMGHSVAVLMSTYAHASPERLATIGSAHAEALAAHLRPGSSGERFPKIDGEGRRWSHTVQLLHQSGIRGRSIWNTRTATFTTTS